MPPSNTPFDLDRLTHYLEAHIDGFQGPISVKKFAGGQSNPTYLLNAPSGQYVLRSKPPGELLQSAHAVDREYIVTQALKDTAMPVARPYCLCEDISIIGSMFYVMSYSAGRQFWNPTLPEVHQDERAPIYNEAIRVMAALHDVDSNAVGLSGYGKHGNYFERQLARWSKQYRAAETETIEPMEALLKWLPANLPQDNGQVSLIHGDYKFDNIIFHPDQPEAIALLDWELSTLGHPMADLAYFSMCLRLPPSGYIQGLKGLDRRALGVLDEQAIIARYCELRGIEKINNWTFYLVFSFFRLAAIAQGVLKRALDGNASNDAALQLGNQTGELAQMAVDLLENHPVDSETSAH